MFIKVHAIVLPFASLALDQNNSISDEELREMLFGEALPQAQEKKTINWVPSYTLESGVGFSDNPLYGPFVQQEATYLESSLEGFFLIETKPEFFTYLYLYGEGKLFEELPEQKSTSIYLGQFEHAYTPNDSDQTFGVRLRHTYYDQGFDFSELGLPFSMSVQSNKSEFIPYYSTNLSNELSATIEVITGTEDFKTITDDNKDSGFSIQIKGTPDILNWTLKADYLQKKYEQRLRRNGDASLLTGEMLETEKINYAVTAEKEYDAHPFQLTRAKLAWSQLQDNGGGYYDYEKISLSLRQELEISSYSIEVTLGGTHTKYDQRLTDNLEIFERKSLTNGVSINREITENVNSYFRWSREEDFSNSRDYEYSSNFWSLGMIWEI